MDAATIVTLAQRLADGETIHGSEFDVPQGPFNDAAIGLVWDSIARDALTAHVDMDERHHQPFGLVHGGVWCVIVESVASIGAQLRAVAHGKVAVGVHNATDFIRPHRRGRVDVVGRPIHAGNNQHLWAVEISRTEDSKLLARGQVRVQLVDADIAGVS